MPQGRDFPFIDTTEVVTGMFDFGPMLSPTATITSITSVTCVTSYGSDASASSRLIGSPQIGASLATGALASAVLQQWGNMVSNVTYVIEATVQTSDSQTLTLYAHQTCVQPN